MKARYVFLTVGILLFVLACGVLATSTPEAAIPTTGATATGEVQISVTAKPSESGASATDTPVAADVNHITRPSDTPPDGKPVFDVDSSGTAPEKRAPYGDSYRINRFERPFLQDMGYVPNLDILSYSVSSDSDWYYVSIALVGKELDNGPAIDYGVEIDLNSDGYGDTLIQAQPPYSTDWNTSDVRVYADMNHDTGGLSADRSDAPLTGDGYETLVFHGGPGDADPDLAWVRMDVGPSTQIQFAFKKSLGASKFMLGVLADGGLKDVTKMDYNDRFTAAEAGSPVRDNPDYPLKSLFGLDNVCRTGVGFTLTGNEPQGCPVKAPPKACPAPPGCNVWDPVACVCTG
ncbi:MAG TPA: hypothetical protein VIV15_15675 [Anaerolineales bacterium]